MLDQLLFYASFGTGLTGFVIGLYFIYKMFKEGV